MKYCAAGCWVAIALAGPSASAIADETPLDPQAIVARTFENLYGFSSVQQVKISSGLPGEPGFTRSAQVVRAGASHGLNRMLVRFDGPPDLRGVAIVLRERENYEYDAFIYQPIFRMVRRVSVYQRHDRFFGTDLSFEDLEGKRPAQWKARFLRDELMLGRKTWVIELTPVEFPSGYEKIIGWFDQQIPVVVHFEFYLKGKQDRHKVVDLDPSAVVQKGGYYIPTHLKFASSQGTETVVRISEIEIRETIPDQRFSASALERGDQRTDAARTEAP